MAKTKLFESWTFRLQLPPPFDDPKYSGAKPMGFSQYNTSSTAQKATLHAPTLRALLAYAKLVSATENGQSVDDLGAIGHQGNTYRISEYRSANKTDCVVFNPVTGKFSAVQIEDGSQVLKPYSLGAGNGSGSALLFCLMPVLNEDDEFRQKFQEFTSHYENGWADMDAAFECALVLCDNVYRRIENSKQLGTDGVKISIPTTGNISVITQMAMDSGNYAPTGASYGNFTIMQLSGNATAKATSFQKEDFVGKYALSNRILTDREKAMVPTLPDWYIIPKEVVRVCEHALFYLELTSGLRRGELLGLEWADLNPETRMLTVNKQLTRSGGELCISVPKTENSIRTIALPENTVALLIDEHNKHPDSPLMFWCPRTNGYWSPDSLRHLHKQMLAAAGVDESVRFHDLRHTFSTLAIQSGVDAKTVAGMLGHYSAAFTLDTYTHVTEQMKRGAAEKIGVFMNASVNVQVNVVHSPSAVVRGDYESDLANCLNPSNSTDLDPTSQ